MLEFTTHAARSWARHAAEINATRALRHLRTCAKTRNKGPEIAGYLERPTARAACARLPAGRIAAKHLFHTECLYCPPDNSYPAGHHASCDTRYGTLNSSAIQHSDPTLQASIQTTMYLLPSVGWMPAFRLCRILVINDTFGNPGLARWPRLNPSGTVHSWHAIRVALLALPMQPDSMTCPQMRSKFIDSSQ